MIHSQKKLLWLGLVAMVAILGLGAPKQVGLAAGAMVGTLDSTTLDTGIAAGGQLNAILWQGSLPGGTSIGFQFATSSNAGGPWNYAGPDGTAGSFYALDQLPGTPFALLPYGGFTGIRYFRYRVTLTSDAAQMFTPRVYDININWSP